jgi:DNA polymerase I-like protein with 3'-5' exonuclease and polymerase domains
MLAHYINRPDFTKQVVEGDPHQYNADLAGVTRPRAKTLLYAIQYGAQAGKVAQIIEGTKEEGAIMRQQFLDRLGISEVMNAAIQEQKVGRVFLVDGSGVVCPSPHAALNYKLQGGGARVMAQAAIFLESYIRHHGLDCLKVGDIHDEWQYDCNPDDASEHQRLSVQAIRDAGEELNLNVPLDGEAKKGLTWAQTH